MQNNESMNLTHTRLLATNQPEFLRLSRDVLRLTPLDADSAVILSREMAA